MDDHISGAPETSDLAETITANIWLLLEMKTYEGSDQSLGPVAGYLVIAKEGSTFPVLTHVVEDFHNWKHRYEIAELPALLFYADEDLNSLREDYGFLGFSSVDVAESRIIIKNYSQLCRARVQDIGKITVSRISGFTEIRDTTPEDFDILRYMLTPVASERHLKIVQALTTQSENYLREKFDRHRNEFRRRREIRKF